MTEQELQHIRLALRVEILKMLVASLYSAFGVRYPEQAEGLRKTIGDLREAYSRLTISGMSAEDSDLIASEYRDAVNDVLAPIEEALPRHWGPLPP